MNFATFFGIIIGFGLLIGSIAYQGTALHFFINVPGLVIVLGGTFAALFISTSFGEAFRLLRVMFVILKKDPPNHEAYIDYVVSLVKRARREGKLSLERESGRIRNLFFRDGLKMLVDGYEIGEIREILEERIVNKIDQEKKEADMFLSMARFAPAFGLLGTLIGLITLLSNLNASSLDQIGPGMAIALVTTFYGVLLSNLVFKPIAAKIDERMNGEVKLMHMVLESLVMIAEEWHPYKVQDYLNSYIRPGKRREPNRREKDF